MLHIRSLSKMPHFVTVFQTGSLTQAAKSLNITPSAVRQSLKQLESELGQQLFTSVGKRYLPTTAGTELFAAVGEKFLSIAHTLAKPQEQVLHLRVGCVPEFAATTAIKRMASFLKKHPTAKVELRLGDTDWLVDDLLHGKLDMIMCDDGPHLDRTALSYLKCHDEPLIMVAAKELAAKWPKEPDLNFLKSQPHVVYNEQVEGVRKWYLHHFKRVPELKWSISVDQVRGVIEAVKLGFGMSVIPFANFLEHKDSLIKIRGKKSELVNQICLAQLKERRRSPLEQEFVKSILVGR
jgi:DNA-binding transcriptional LysR family regulator